MKTFTGMVLGKYQAKSKVGRILQAIVLGFVATFMAMLLTTGVLVGFAAAVMLAAPLFAFISKLHPMLQAFLGVSLFFSAVFVYDELEPLK